MMKRQRFPSPQPSPATTTCDTLDVVGGRGGPAYGRSANACKSKAGMTLIEVLIALAIVAIALTAVIKTVSENIRSTAHLQNKTIAMWVAKEILNEVRVGILPITTDSEGEPQTTTMLGRKWDWQVAQEDTPNQHIKKITVKVFAKQPGSENDSDTPLISLETYVLPPQ